MPEIGDIIIVYSHQVSDGQHSTYDSPAIVNGVGDGYLDVKVLGAGPVHQARVSEYDEAAPQGALFWRESGSEPPKFADPGKPLEPGEVVGSSDLSVLPTGGTNGDLRIRSAGKEQIVHVVDSFRAADLVEAINQGATVSNSGLAASVNDKNQIVIKGKGPVKISGPEPLLKLLGIQSGEGEKKDAKVEKTKAAPAVGPGPQVGTGKPNEDKFPKG